MQQLDKFVDTVHNPSKAHTSNFTRSYYQPIENDSTYHTKWFKLGIATIVYFCFLIAWLLILYGFFETI